MGSAGVTIAVSDCGIWRVRHVFRKLQHTERNLMKVFSTLRFTLPDLTSPAQVRMLWRKSSFRSCAIVECLIQSFQRIEYYSTLVCTISKSQYSKPVHNTQLAEMCNKI